MKWSTTTQWSLPIFLMCLLFNSIQEGNGWPMFQHDPQHTGFSSSTMPESLREAWMDEKYGMITYAAISDGTISVTRHHSLSALDATTGVKLWNYEVKGQKMTTEGLEESWLTKSSSLLVESPLSRIRGVQMDWGSYYLTLSMANMPSLNSQGVIRKIVTIKDNDKNSNFKATQAYEGPIRTSKSMKYSKYNNTVQRSSECSNISLNTKQKEINMEKDKMNNIGTKSVIRCNFQHLQLHGQALQAKGVIR